MDANFNWFPLNSPYKPIHLPLIVQGWGCWGFGEWLHEMATVVKTNQTPPENCLHTTFAFEPLACLLFYFPELFPLQSKLLKNNSLKAIK